MLARSLVVLLALVSCSPTIIAGTSPPDGAAVDTSVSDAAVDDGAAVDASPRDVALDGASRDLGVACSGHDMTSFPSFGRACNADSDCTIAMHQTDCCGSLLALGIATSEAARFAEAESACDAMYPGCGCASGRVGTDDGSMAPLGSDASAVVVHCARGMCATTVRAPAPCGSATCTATQVCVRECSGVPLPDGGSLPSHCVDVPSACAASSSCACFGAARVCPTGTCVRVEHGVPLCLCA